MSILWPSLLHLHDVPSSVFAQILGVNDNGSGMAALLEIARVLVDTFSDAVTSPLKEFENSVILVAFDQKEMVTIDS